MIYIALTIFILSILFFVWQNNSIVITNIQYTNPELPQGFDAYKILQVSDLHNKDFWNRLMKRVKEIRPDIIIVTGDLIDRHNTEFGTAIELVRQFAYTAPVFYVSGNHEHLSGKYNELKDELIKSGVKITDNEYLILEKTGDMIGLMGIADPSKNQKKNTYLWMDNSAYVRNSLKSLLGNAETDFNILLSHRPELFNIYKEMGIELTFSGHAHGGQIRLPLIGGLFAPNQGLLPKYTAGIYHDGTSSMIVSRGLGNSIFPLRIFNRPELVVITLTAS